MSSNISNTISIQVPVNIVDEILIYMNKLNLHIETNGQEEREVESVLNHRVIEDSKFQFLLEFKGYSCPEWTDDENCDCEELIGQYLGKLGIHTAYIFCLKDQEHITCVSLKAQEMALRQFIATMPQYERIRVFSVPKSVYDRIPELLVGTEIFNMHYTYLLI